MDMVEAKDAEKLKLSSKN